MPVLAQRPAPLQVTWLGFPGTTGAPYIDYLIGDAVVTPLADAAHFSEKIAQMPHCYQPNDARRVLPAPATRADVGLADDALVLCAFHQSYKISAEVFATWCDLLQRAARIGAVAAAMERQRAAVADRGGARARHRRRSARLRAAAAAGGSPQPARLRRPVPRRLAVQRPHDGGRGALGRRSGRHRAGAHLRPARRRQPAAHLRPRRAGRAATSPPIRRWWSRWPAMRRAAPRCATQLVGAAHARAPLFDGAAFARDIESLYRRMWQRAVTGQAPAHLPRRADRARRRTERCLTRGRSGRRRRARERCGRCAAPRRRCRAPAPSPRRRGRTRGRPTGGRSAPCRARTRPARAPRA